MKVVLLVFFKFGVQCLFIGFNLDIGFDDIVKVINIYLINYENSYCFVFLLI